MQVKEGDTVKVDYTGKFDDGTVFDSSEGKQPLEFEAGAGRVIKGFDNAVIGMKKDEEKEIKLKPEEAYGESKPELIQKVPKDQFPPEPKPELGMMLLLKSKEGNQFPAKITEISDKEITLDMNHPMAGKNLNFTIKVVDVKSKE
jgi:FKBP-type peptidyl-prolyl cis-trans isomerase 2